MTKILLFDIETAPMLGYVWSLWENNVALNQLNSDWHILSWSAKWLGDPPSKIMYQDQRKAKNIQDDKFLLKKIWALLDEADVVITQNGKSFDVKKLNARFILNGMQPTSTFRHIDTMRLAKKHFAFTSNKLEYMSDKLCVKYKKLKPAKFQGFNLWKECMSGNLAAWREMEKYNKYDVLALEELYSRLIPWDATINLSVYGPCDKFTCSCGSEEYKNNGFAYTNVAKYQRYKCVKCGKETRSRKNLFLKDEIRTSRVATSR